MMDDIQRLILQIIDEKKDELTAFAKDMYQTGEPGFREFETSRKSREICEALGLPVTKGLAVTGWKASLPRKEGVTVAAIGELDGISCPRHPFANPLNKISHACGHHCQMTALLGCAAALSHPRVREAMDGNVDFFAVPSEEYTDLEYKIDLMKQGKIKYGGGKSEMIRLGLFDHVQICVAHHLHMVETHNDVLLGFHTTNGFLVKYVTLHGKASHAAIAPHQGVNALNAASLGLNALAFQRETFRDMDYVRVHSIVSKGGNMVNVVPDEVVVENQVRAKNMAAMMDASAKTNRAFEAGAHAMGARLTITDYAGYLPILEEPVCRALQETGHLLGRAYAIEDVDKTVHNCASTDVGDLSHLMPVVGFTTGGFEGALHSADFRIVDEDKAYVLPAKIMALTIYNLLKNGAKNAVGVIDTFPQHLTKQEYLEYMDKFDRAEEE